jgi:propanediol utilization protein
MSTVTGNGRMDRAAVERVVRQIVRERLGQQRAAGPQPNLVVNISARHMHITQETLEVLFGEGAELTVHKPLYQDGYFASQQMVTIIGPRHRTISNLRILGPTRPENQIELSFTDGIALGVDLPVRMSGKIEGTPGCIVLGPKGHVVLEQGLIRAQRHAHMHPDDAAYYGIQNGDLMRLHVDSSCPTTFDDIICRVSEKVKLEVHLDTDEGNACDLANARRVDLVKQ